MDDSQDEKWHTDQIGVRDPLATREQLRARVAGIYDPRPASGPIVAKRVRVLCGECGFLKAEIYDFELRPLVHNPTKGTWSHDKFAFAGEKCRECFSALDYGEPVQIEEIESAVELARTKSSVQTIRVAYKRRDTPG